ncbi:MAG: GNAT family N-acetyltransferase [Fibrobacter sp.]|nr:GNAT family N-acetyltransferase [Fibrobacter sp.]
MLSPGLSEKEFFKIVRLKPSHAIKKFDCGDADLNDFILNRAAEFQKHRLSVSYACVDADDASKVYAYCSLANDKVAITDFKDKTEFNRFRKKQGFPNEKRLKSYPAVKLCRLGVDEAAKGKQIGTTVLDYIKSMFFIENKAGCRFLTVDAYLKAVPFYKKNGFHFMNVEDNDPHTRLMFFDLMDLEA